MRGTPPQRPDLEEGERPRRDRAATRLRLLEAARDLFGEHGYDHVTVRMIANAAEVNVALVHRYFGSKAALFGEVLAGESALRRVVVSGGTEDLPGRLAGHIVRQLRGGPTNPLLRALDRSANDPDVRPIVRRHVETSLIEPISEQLDGPDARLRATAAATIVLGAGSIRRLLGAADLADADPEALTTRLAAMLRAALDP